MKHVPAQWHPRIAGLVPLLLLLAILAPSQTPEKKSTLRQGAFLTEEEGRQELAEFSKTYTNLVQRENRADNIRQNILIGAELAPPPEKTPLKPIIHSRRSYDGYTVENVAFESIPGFFVTGNLYRPTRKRASCSGSRPMFGGRNFSATGRSSLRSMAL